MRYEVAGAWTYTIGIASSAVMEDGRERAATDTNELTQRVEISPAVPPRQRLPFLLKGVATAWLSHIGGTPADEEGVVELLASFAKSAMKWAAANGGEIALMRLAAGDAPQPGAARVALTQSRSCAICQQTVAPGLVECLMDPDEPGRAIMRLYCEGCGHLQTWREGVQNGIPTAQDVSEPTFERGAMMSAFLKRHGGYGVLMRD